MNLSRLFKKGFPVGIIILFIMSCSFPGLSGDTNRTKDIYINNIENIEFVPGEFIIKFKGELQVHISKSASNCYITGISSIDALNEKYNINSIETLFEFHESQNLFNIFKFKLRKDYDILSIVQDYALNPNVVYAEPNYISRVGLTPNDPDFYLQYALHNTGQTNGTVDADIDAVEAWDIETGDENIVICIHDTGVDWDHPDLADNIWINSGEDLNGNGVVDPSDFNGVDDDSNGFIDDIRGWDFVETSNPVYPGEDGTIPDNNPMDFHGHGTHCSGIASAVTNNNIGIAGVCWNCSIMSVRVGYMAPSGNGYIELDDGALGLVYAADNGAHIISMSWGGYEITQLIWDAVNYTYSQGVILVAAAGNGNTDSKLYPAGYEKVIAVSATDHNDTRAGFSNYGSWVDVAAPGVDIYSTLFNDKYDSWSGTSMATPTVAGLVGLILSKNPGFNQEEVRTIIRSTTDPVNSKNYIGTGRINAYKAIQRDSTPIVDLDSDLDDVFIYDEININGTAIGTTFVNYSVYYGVGVYPDEWTLIETSSTPVTNGILAVWNPPTNLEEKYCTILLLVYDTDDQISQDRVVLSVNRAPYEPEIYGPERGKPGIDYDFSFVSSDLNEDDVYYYVDWGDETFLEWIGPYSCNEIVTLNHTYSETGTYIIKSKAKDIYDDESSLSEFEVTIPRARFIYYPLLIRLFERFQNTLSILQQLLGL